MKLDIKVKISIYVVAVIIIIAFISYFIILPTIRDIQSIKKAVYLEREDLERKYLRGQLLNKTIEDFERIKPEKDKLLSIFITEGEELEFITDLEEIAGRHNIEQNIKLQSNKSRENFYFSLPLEISGTGNFTQILRYLKDIERLKYYFNIKNIAASTSQGGGTLAPINVTLSGKIYGVPIEEKSDL
ncbi:type 4a pilus biogenesis protein PilO [Candidatus Falkowbacteria bacterium]|nr:type 4a pilus biogenesis protein PilO [Candidatus Falkowbacteria bacterium]